MSEIDEIAEMLRKSGDGSVVCTVGDDWVWRMEGGRIFREHWPECAVAGCTNRVYCRERTKYCYPHNLLKKGMLNGTKKRKKKPADVR